MNLPLPWLLLSLLLCGAVAAQEPFTDDFDEPALDQRWEWFVPKAGPELSLTAKPGWLRIRLPAIKDGYNHWWDVGADKAPLLLTTAPEGSFAVETHVRIVSYSAHSNFHLALVAAPSKRYVLGWGPFFAPLLGNPKDRPQVWAEPTGLGHFAAAAGYATDVYLQIKRTGNLYRFSLRRAPDAPWQEIDQWRTFWPARYVGLMGKTFGDKGPVVAEVDYIRVQALPEQAPEPVPASIAVDCDGEVRPLCPLRFGHFLEPIFNCIDGGIWAEMLVNRKFTGKTTAQGAAEAWQPYEARRGVTLRTDNDRVYYPSQSQRIEITRRGRPSGIMQTRRVLQAARSYQVRLVAAQEGLKSPVYVGFRSRDEVISQVELRDIGSEWTTRSFTLEARLEDTRPREADFFIAAEGPGTLWLGAVSLMPADNLDGFRADVVAALREIKPATIRWPGGNFASGYDWRDGIGERDRRPPRWNRAWGQWEWNDLGTHEFLRLCELLVATPHLTVNAGEGSAPEAAAWVEYCNGSPKSRWGRLRVRNGHPAPWRVPIWSIGNEMYGDWQLGHLSATNYALKGVEFAKSMRAVDPKIKLIGAGVESDGWGGWNREVSRLLGPQLDYLSVHYYCGVDDFADPVLNYSVVGGAAQSVEHMLRRTYDIATETAGKPLPISFDEWNIPHPFKPAPLRDGLFACRLFNALNRLGDRVPLSNLALMVNIMGLVNANAEGIDRTGTHRAFELCTRDTGDLAVPVQVTGPVVDLPNAPNCPVLDASATLSEDRRTLYLAVVNLDPVSPVAVPINLGSFVPGDAVEVNTLTAETPEAINTQAKPDQIRLTEETVTLSEAATYTFPPHSATVLVFRARQDVRR